MTRVWRLMFLATAVVVVATPTSLWAQGRGHGRGHDKDRHERRVHVPDDRDERVIRDRDRDRDDDDDDFARDRRRDGDIIVLRDVNGRLVRVYRSDVENRYQYGRQNRRGNGPPFCRSGAGHPVHGRRWCIEKGWGLGNDDLRLRQGRAIVDRDDRVIFRDGDQIVVARRRVDRDDEPSWLERIYLRAIRARS